MLARAQHPLVSTLQARFTDMLSPVVSFVSQPVSLTRSLLRDKHALLNAFEDNKQLREENETLRRWQSIATALKAENDALRALANYQPVAHVSYISARVIGQSPGSYASSLLIDGGTANGIKSLQPVIDAYGLIGRVTEPGSHASHVLLLSDSTSRVPVITATSRLHAIANGTGKSDELLRLTFLGGDAANVTIGEPVVTTEEGGLIPGGIMVGTVVKREAMGLLVKPMRPFAQSEYVRVIETQ